MNVFFRKSEGGKMKWSIVMSVRATLNLARSAEDIIQGIASEMDAKIQPARATVAIFISIGMMNANAHLLKCVMLAFFKKVIGPIETQRILSNGNKSGTCSPIIRYINLSRRDILTSIKSDIKSLLAPKQPFTSCHE